MHKSTFSASVPVPAEKLETVLSAFVLSGMLGCEERPGRDSTTLTAYFSTRAAAEAAAASVRPFTATEIPVTEVERRDWLAEWRASMKPARLCRGWYVSPAWLPPPAAARWIKIEPKMAFGTGHHETTRLAARAIIGRRRRINGKRFLDIGTGSGVLCLVAEACGAGLCAGLDIDPGCAENCAENLRSNPPAGRVAFVIGTTDSLTQEARFDVIVMNMLLC